MKNLFFLFIVASLLTSCIGEDFVDDFVVLDPKIRITTGSALGQDTLFVGDTVFYMAEYVNSSNQVEAADFEWFSSDTSVASVTKEGKVIALKKGVSNLTVSANGLSLDRFLIVNQLERVEIQAPATSILVGQEINFSAQYYNRIGVLSSANFVWTSSNASVASIDANGKVIGLQSGQTEIKASVNGLSSNPFLFTVVTDTNSAASVTINAPSDFILVGETKAYTAEVRNINGNIISNQTISWSSTVPSVLTINNSGMATGVGPGTAAITASTNGINSVPYSITVASDTSSVASIDIDMTNLNTSLFTGETAQLTAIAKNINGTPIMNQNIMWSSSNLSVLTIDNNGLATAISPGSSNVTATSNNITSSAVNFVVQQQMTTSRTGSFKGRGSYRVSGDVTVSVQSNGSLKVEFASNFSTSNGPGLYVYLSNSTSGGLDIGKLPKTSGSFTLFPPSNVGINDYNYVLIWCKPFGVTFGEARLN